MDDISPQYAWIDPCETGRYCGNGAITVRHVEGIGPVKMCESCAAEYDEQ